MCNSRIYSLCHRGDELVVLDIKILKLNVLIVIRPQEPTLDLC